MQFEWDPRKAKANLVKHDVSFEEAIMVFADPLARIFDEEEHSEDEQREIIIGHSIRQHLILVKLHMQGRESASPQCSQSNTPGAQRL